MFYTAGGAYSAPPGPIAGLRGLLLTGRGEELIPSTDSASSMPPYFTSLLTWNANNDMQINTTKNQK